MDPTNLAAWRKYGSWEGSAFEDSVAHDIPQPSPIDYHLLQKFPGPAYVITQTEDGQSAEWFADVVQAQRHFDRLAFGCYGLKVISVWVVPAADGGPP